MHRVRQHLLCPIRFSISLGITGQALLAGLHKVLGPFVIQALRYTFSSAQLGYAVLAAQSIQHNADLLVGIVLLARLTIDVTNNLF